MPRKPVLTLVSAVLSEEQEQWDVMSWSQKEIDTYPDLKLLFHIPNGGWRHIATARKLRWSGVKPGVPDLFLPVPRGGFPGLWIEMKSTDKSAKTSEHQEQWIGDLREKGYKVAVCRGSASAIRILKWYLSLDAGVGCPCFDDPLRKEELPHAA